MDEIFNILSSSARFDKSKRKKKKKESQLQLANESDTNNGSSILALPQKRTKEEEMGNKKQHSQSKLNQIHQEEIAAFRNRLGISLSQSNRHDPTLPDPISSFRELNKPVWWDEDDKHTFTSVRNTIVRNVERGRWINPTPIQMQGITALLGRRDVLGCAPTGSGKSGAFIIPSLLLSSVSDDVFYKNTKKGDGDNDNDGDNKKETKSEKKKKQKNTNSKGGGKIRALLLAPSRELAAQLHREVERLGEGKLHGLRSALLSRSNASTICSNYDGSSNNSRGLDVLVSTPLRLLECLEHGSGGENGKKLDLGSVRVVILDEADRLLDGNDGWNNKSNDDKAIKESAATAASDHKSGSSHVKTFLAQIDTILSNVPKTAVRALFSATIGSSVKHLAESILRNQIDISTGSKTGNTTASGVNDNISQKLTFVGREEGKLLAIRQIIAKGLKPPVIIFLQSKDRAQALFMELRYDGVNVDVIHAGKSQSARDAAVAKFRKGETWILICTDLCARGLDFKAVNMVINYDLPTSGVTYVHRIGRCGRAGRKGEAITLFTEADFEHLRNIANVMKHSGCDVPDWMLSLKNNGRGNKQAPVKRKDIDTGSGYDKKKLHRKKQCIERSKARRSQGN
jgi:ATP-dependent RNA helicase DDX52/ROK1